MDYHELGSIKRKTLQRKENIENKIEKIWCSLLHPHIRLDSDNVKGGYKVDFADRFHRLQQLDEDLKDCMAMLGEIEEIKEKYSPICKYERIKLSYYYDGLPPKELAEKFDIHERTVYRAIKR